MQQSAPVGIAATLEHLHRRLDVHFSALSAERAKLGSGVPVFALEHALAPDELESLRSFVRAAVAQGFPTNYRKWWLPFVIHAAESGYSYAGGEYWHTFEEDTPRWDDVGDRDWIGYQFAKFATTYGGVQPRGAFARHFSIISWPILHAVLPMYLQRNLAQLLFEFRAALTNDLLGNPEELGARLATRTGGYTERFRIFCENTALLGSVAVALLGEGDDSPYLLQSTLRRLVEDLNGETESRSWLTSARQTASGVRAKGFLPPKALPPASPVLQNRSQTTDPKLSLRRQEDGGWQLYAALPDLSPLGSRLPEIVEELRTRRAVVEGFDGAPLARQRLLFPGQVVHLARWPRAEVPFIELAGAPEHINRLLADQCVARGGAPWLFRERMVGAAVEVMGRTIRPGEHYVLVQDQSAPILDVAWTEEASLHTPGKRADMLHVPDKITEADRTALLEVGLSVVSDLIIHPVGFVASSWDGEGDVEWLVGERAALVLACTGHVSRCEITLDGVAATLSWPSGQQRLFVQLEDLSVGTHQLVVSSFSPDGSPVGNGALSVTIRDPQVRPESATAAEGVRLLASPTRPTLTDLWDGHASLSIEGPPNTTVSLAVSLRLEGGSELAQLQHSVELPVAEEDWAKLAKQIRAQPKFLNAYDDAESVEISVSRAGVGFARLVCDRGYRPLRWRIKRLHGHGFTARLIDRTNGASTGVELFTVEDPLRPIPFDHGATVDIPPLGGLLRAVTGDSEQTVLLPTQPNEVMRAGHLRPTIDIGAKTSGEILRLARAYAMWDEAELPADPFAEHLQNHVLKTVARETVSLIGGTYWSAAERRHIGGQDGSVRITNLQNAVGVAPHHQRLAAQIAGRVSHWTTPADLLAGFTEIISPELDERRGFPAVSEGAKFLLLLAGRPGQIVGWNPTDREAILNAVVSKPVLLRVARFAVLGAPMIDQTEKGFTL